MRPDARDDGSPSGEALLAHLEASLGPFLEQESSREGDRRFSILAFSTPERRTRMYSTFGVSRHVLELGDASTAQELTLAARDRRFALGILDAIGRYVVDAHVAVRHGQRHRLPAWDEASAIVGVVAVRDPDLAPFLAADPAVEFLRLLPITASEARFATDHGTDALVGRLTSSEVELADAVRKPAL